MKYVASTTNLTLNTKQLIFLPFFERNVAKQPQLLLHHRCTVIGTITTWVALSGIPWKLFSLIFILSNSEYGFMLSLALKFILALKFRKTLFQLLFTILSIYIFHLVITPIASILCILVFQNWCHCGTQSSPQWLQNLLLILSNDVSRNPGPPFHNSFFSLISWNVNSIAKDDFQRVRVIEAHLSIQFNLQI